MEALKNLTKEELIVLALGLQEQIEDLEDRIDTLRYALDDDSDYDDDDDLDEDDDDDDDNEPYAFV